MKFTIVLFTLILVTVAAAATTTTTAAANRIQNKAYAYYYCNSYCTQAVNDENFVVIMILMFQIKNIMHVYVPNQVIIII